MIICLQSLWTDPDFASHLVFASKCHYKDADWTIWIYSKIHTSNWWWSVQVSFASNLVCDHYSMSWWLQKSLKKEKPGATIIPIIISSDKTQLILFHNKLAYLIYIIFDNLPNNIHKKPSRHAQILIGYLPTTQLNHFTNNAACCCVMGNLFHNCVCKILEPLRCHSKEGLAIVSGDGIWRYCHPILAIFVGDYPE